MLLLALLLPDVAVKPTSLSVPAPHGRRVEWVWPHVAAGLGNPQCGALRNRGLYSAVVSSSSARESDKWGLSLDGGAARDLRVDSDSGALHLGQLRPKGGPWRRVGPPETPTAPPLGQHEPSGTVCLSLSALIRAATPSSRVSFSWQHPLSTSVFSHLALHWVPETAINGNFQADAVVPGQEKTKTV